jgi:hypothetical protein
LNPVRETLQQLLDCAAAHQAQPDEAALAAVVDSALEFAEAYWAKERARRGAWRRAHEKTWPANGEAFDGY